LAKVKGIIDTLIAATGSHIDPARIYITGLSMGGMGTMHMVQLYPGFFAAAITAPGGLNSGQVPNYADYATARAGTSAGQAGYSGIPIWLVTIKGDFMEGSSYTIWDGLKTAGANVRWTYYTINMVPEAYGFTHASWTAVLTNRITTDCPQMVISATQSGVGYSAVVSATTGPAGRNPNDSAGKTIMEWLFDQHL
jgi:predicted peptidase